MLISRISDVVQLQEVCSNQTSVSRCMAKEDSAMLKLMKNMIIRDRDRTMLIKNKIK